MINLSGIISSSRVVFDWLARAIPYLPLTIALVTIIVFYRKELEVAQINDFYVRLGEKELSKSQEIAINLTIELNKYVVTIGASLFGLVGFYVNNYSKPLTVRSIKLAFLLTLFLLGLGGYYAFLIYTALTNSLSQGAYPLNPEGSTVLGYIELEFILCLGASLVLGSIFIATQFVNVSNNPS